MTTKAIGAHCAITLRALPCAWQGAESAAAAERHLGLRLSHRILYLPSQ
jgi:hypothetical protein